LAPAQRTCRPIRTDCTIGSHHQVAGLLIGFFAWRAVAFGVLLGSEARELLFIQALVFAAALGPVYLGMRWLMRQCQHSK
jgi:hypothetical protein